MGFYDFKSIESKWQKFWKENSTFAAGKPSEKPKFYVLDMFPYPSGAGLHVGHPLGYIASDIVARYKRHTGHNVMHPMGYDAFGLPAEQYAIETGTHPRITTEKNINRYQQQLEILGLAYDPKTTEVKTCDPSYYKWTQWIFLQLFNSWYNLDKDKAEDIETLIAAFENSGNTKVNAFSDDESEFSEEEWKSFSEKEKHEILLKYRLAYLSYGFVNWCPALGTVLANDEIVNGVSERGGHPVEKVKMRQWVLRMTAYADRLLDALHHLDWPESLKEMQRNWIGRSEGAELSFKIKDHDERLDVFTTRPDTIFGSTFMVIAPEHDLIEKITTDDQREAVENYVKEAGKRSEIERMAEGKTVTGVFTGAYAINPFTGDEIPVWTADYVLAGYGTGAIMAVPAGDERDHRFAQKFDIEIRTIFEGKDSEEEAWTEKSGVLCNSGFLNGMKVEKAILAAIEKIESEGIGEARVNYKLRDPNFSRQRYWGEPFPIKYKDGIPYALDESELPVTLPEVESYEPSDSGESPLAKAEDWVNEPEGGTRETHTMPGYAGSSWYFLRYLDPENDDALCGKELEKYWMNVDLYIGGSEHAVGHLLYARFWTQFLFDKGLVSYAEPFQKLVNQGMIQGRSSLVYRIKGENKFVSAGLKAGYDTDPIHVDINLAPNDELNIAAFRKWREDYKDAEFILEDGVYKTGWEIEKMSKRYYNVVNPDDMCEQYGADTFRCYEMFLGPLEMSKPWITNGIEGVFRFLKKVWSMYIDEEDKLILTDEKANEDELRILHQTIKKAGEDIDKLSFNTTIPQFMILVNEFTKMNTHKREVLEPFVILLSPFAPHIAEELWNRMGNEGSISSTAWPEYKESYLEEKAYEYPVQINGKVRAKVKLSLDLSKDEIAEEVLKSEDVLKYIEGKELRKTIVVPGRIVNLVV